MHRVGGGWREEEKKKVRIEITISYHYTSIRMAKGNKIARGNVDEDLENLDLEKLIYCWWECKMVQSLETILVVS